MCIHLDKSKYLPKEEDKVDQISEDTKKALEDLDAIEQVTNTFTAKAIENAKLIFNTTHFSDSVIFNFVNMINHTTYGEKANAYLQQFHMDAAKIILLVVLIKI